MSTATVTNGATSTQAVAGPPRAAQQTWSCRGCGTAGVTAFLDHGQQPIANGFLRGDALADERFYRIRYGLCPACGLVQLLDDVPPAAMFTAQYPFLTGSSAGMVAYYAELAATLRDRWQPRQVLEIGCNDGTLLSHFQDLPHRGIEPSANVASLARARGLEVETRWWDVATACHLATTWRGDVDLLLAAHVATHCPDLNGFFEAAELLLSDRGVLVLEDPSLEAVVQAGDFAQLYDEHSWVFSVPAIARTAERHGLVLVDAEPTPTHGGSMRLTLAREGASVPRARDRVRDRLSQERYLTKPWTFRLFAERADGTLRRLAELLRGYQERGWWIAGYGASSKLTLTLNRLAQLGLPPGTVRYVTDTTPAKVGKVMPGTHEPIIKREDAERRPPQVFLLGAYVHAKEVLEKEQAFLERGGKFVVWTPTVRTISREEG